MRFTNWTSESVLIADQLRDTPEQSNRAIGATLGVSDNTVRAIRGELESGAQIAHLDQRVGKDGKAQSAHKSTTMARDGLLPREPEQPLPPRTWCLTRRRPDRRVLALWCGRGPRL